MAVLIGKNSQNRISKGIAGLILLTLFTGCGQPQLPAIRVDGSSTVFQISAAASELIAETHPEINVVVKHSGTSSGMSKFLLEEVDICNASRQITPTEVELAESSGIEILEFAVALDGIAIAVNPKNDWVDSLTVEQLKTIWQPEATDQLMRWNQADPEWPDLEMKLYGPGTASGTFEYFTSAINGKQKASRSDYTASENDNTLVNGVAGDRGSLGYFGLAYYLENTDKLKLVAIDGGNGPVEPNEQTVKAGSYAPLSRPLYIYVNKKLLSRPEGKTFIQFYLENAAQMATLAKHVDAPEAMLKENLELLAAAIQN